MQEHYPYNEATHPIVQAGALALLRSLTNCCMFPCRPDYITILTDAQCFAST